MDSIGQARPRSKGSDRTPWRKAAAAMAGCIAPQARRPPGYIGVRRDGQSRILVDLARASGKHAPQALIPDLYGTPYVRRIGSILSVKVQPCNIEALERMRPSPAHCCNRIPGLSARLQRVRDPSGAPCRGVGRARAPGHCLLPPVAFQRAACFGQWGSSHLPPLDRVQEPEHLEPWTAVYS